MRWFEGNVAAAVQQAKSRNAVFVVYLDDHSERARVMATAFENTEVSARLEGENFVSLKLEAGTETYLQFTQIYTNPPVPCIYFIGRSGEPLDIVVQTLGPNSMVERLQWIEDRHLGKTQASAPVPSDVLPVESGSSASLAPLEPKQAKTEEGEQVADVPTPSTSTASLENRVERAKELLEEKKMKKQMQEEEETRQKEIQRRKEGQNVQELRRWQQEQDLKQLREERMREKRIEQEARQRVLDQIAQDRADRVARSAAPTATSIPAQSVATPASTLTNSNEARLQFRLPDSSTHSNRFSADSTLADVRQYISANIPLPCQNFALATAFPRREFSSQDNALSLRDLQLVPSSVILVIPAGGSRAVQQSGLGLMGMVQTLWMFVTYPVSRVISFIQLFIYGAPPASNPTNPTSGPSTGSSQGQSQSNAQQEKRSQRKSGGAYRRAGNSNVHRLHQNHSSSDDENNTWNGNSTQQM